MASAATSLHPKLTQGAHLPGFLQFCIHPTPSSTCANYTDPILMELVIQHAKHLTRQFCLISSQRACEHTPCTSPGRIKLLASWGGKNSQVHACSEARREVTGKNHDFSHCFPTGVCAPPHLPLPGFILNIQTPHPGPATCASISLASLSFYVKKTCWPCLVLLSRPAVHRAVITGASASLGLRYICEGLRHHWSHWVTLNSPYSELFVSLGGWV